jgi:serine/threonine-protein kinase RsbW
LIDLDLAVVEAANNIVLHGYDSDESQHFEVYMQARSEGLTVLLADRGRPVPAPKLEAPSLAAFDAECGRGFGIIRACVDSFGYESQGGVNRLTLFKKRSDRAAEP